MKCYGLPYTGSKNRLAEKIIAHFPEADTLVDGFFGGGAITHCAMAHNKFKNYIVNDLRTTPQFFKECLEGKHSNNTKWVSCEDFNNSPRDDWFVRLLWSFSNNCNIYLYGKRTEPIKKAFHYAVCFNDFSLLEDLYPKFITDKIKEYLESIPTESWNERRLAAQHTIAQLIRTYPDKLTRKDFCVSADGGSNLLQHLERSQRMQITENLSRLNRLNHIAQLDQLPNIECYNLDYRLLADIIPDNSVVYLDPPYKGTFDYNEKSTGGGMMQNTNLFNTEEFLDWAYEVGQKHPTFISEHNIDDSRFTLVDEWARKCSAAGHSKRRSVTERLYTVK